MPDTRLTLVSAKRHTPYSGMLPGLIAGHYDYHQSHIDLARLTGYARAGFLEMEAVALDARERLLVLADGRRVEYDILSIDIGSTPPTFGIPGVPEHVIPAKPIEALLPAWDGLCARAAGLKRLALVGGGAAGVELVLAMQYRLRQDGAASRQRKQRHRRQRDECPRDERHHTGLFGRSGESAQRHGFRARLSESAKPQRITGAVRSLMPSASRSRAHCRWSRRQRATRTWR